MSASIPKACHVFVSYAHKDRERARTLVELLKARGLSCWFDEDGLRGGADYEAEILKAIRSSAVVMPLLSQAAFESNFVRYEVAAARGVGKPVLQVKLDPLPFETIKEPFSAREQIADLSTGITDGTALQRLAEDLESLTVTHKGRRQFKQLAVVVIVALMLYGLWHLLFTDLPLGKVLARNEPPPPNSDSWNLLVNAAGAREVRATESAYSARRFQPQADGSFRPQLAFEVFGLMRGATNWIALGPENSLASGERFFIRAETFTPGFLYVFLVDSSDRLQWLFPATKTFQHSSGQNPVSAQATADLPPGQNVYVLDDTVGEERVFAIFSATRWPGLEEALDRAATSQSHRDVESLLSLADELAARAKGIASVAETPVAKQMRHGDSLVDLPARSALANGYWLLQVRRFRHVAAGG